MSIPVYYVLHIRDNILHNVATTNDDRVLQVEEIGMTNSPETITTGVPGLDDVLGGGLAPSALVCIIGPPGAGKTVVASQILFTAARAGTHSLIITASSEGPVKLIEHLRSFDFYDDSLMGSTITIFTLTSIVAANPAEATATIMRTIRESRAKLVLIDGVQGFASIVREQEPFHQVLASLSSQLSYLKTTVLMTLTGDVRDTEHYAALTTADVIIGLSFTVQHWRHVRLLEVVKRRGHAQLPGQHIYTLSSTGMTIFPRLEVRPIVLNQPRPHGRIVFGLPELDKILGGGLNAGTLTILAGAPGAGKTTLALYWSLTAARPEAKTIFVSFHEYSARLEEKATTFSLDLRTAINSGALLIMRFDPTEIVPDIIAQQILDTLADGTTQRLVIDDISPLLRALDERGYSFLSALSAQLYAAGITGLILQEIEPLNGFRLSLGTLPIGILGENLIVIQQQEAQGALRRLLAVIRMRFSDYDRTIRELILDSNGITVLSPDQSSVGVLNAAATASGSVAPTHVSSQPSTVAAHDEANNAP